MQNIAEIVPRFSYTTLNSHSTVTSNGTELFYRGQIIYKIQLYICGHVQQKSEQGFNRQFWDLDTLLLESEAF